MTSVMPELKDRHFGDPKFGGIALKVLFYEFGEGMRIDFATSAWM